MSDEPRILTFGCRLNALESEVMRGHVRSAGLTDAIIVNTCAVTAEAERQARQAIRRARRNNPEAQIVVTGCAAQIDPGAFERMPEVDRVLGELAASFSPRAAFFKRSPQSWKRTSSWRCSTSCLFSASTVGASIRRAASMREKKATS